MYTVNCWMVTDMVTAWNPSWNVGLYKSVFISARRIDINKITTVTHDNDNDILTKWNESDTQYLHIWGEEIETIITQMSEEIKSACKNQSIKSENSMEAYSQTLLNDNRPYSTWNKMIWVMIQCTMILMWDESKARLSEPENRLCKGTSRLSSKYFTTNITIVLYYKLSEYDRWNDVISTLQVETHTNQYILL